MYLQHVFNLGLVRTFLGHLDCNFNMCLICYYHEIAGLIQPKLPMFSTCNHWFQAPSPPVNPHPEQVQENRIVDLSPIHLLKPFHSLDHIG